MMVAGSRRCKRKKKVGISRTILEIDYGNKWGGKSWKGRKAKKENGNKKVT